MSRKVIQYVQTIDNDKQKRYKLLNGFKKVGIRVMNIYNRTRKGIPTWDYVNEKRIHRRRKLLGLWSICECGQQGGG